MKVTNIHQAHSLMKNCQQYDKKQANISYNTNPIKSHYYKPINFGSQKSLTLSSLYENGYEQIKINNYGKIENGGKFLIINSPEQLLAIAKNPEALNKYFILTNDIDMNGIDFKPIGTVNKPFTGVFDGNGYSVKNLNISLPDSDDVGFFSATENAKISNLSLENAIVSAKNEVGALIGHAKHTNISDCVINCKVGGDIGVGGLIGVSKYNQITGAEVSGEIKANVKAKANNLFEESSTEQISSYFGGITAIDEGSSITASYSNAKIISDSNVGGIVGSTNSYIPTKINDSVFDGKIIGKQNIGAIVGNSGNTILTRCYSIGQDLGGSDSNCKKFGCFNSINELKIKNWNDWDSKVWNLTPKTLPRLKGVIEKSNPINIFLEDVNNSRKNGLFPNSSMRYSPPEFIDIPLNIIPVKHYPENNEILETIKNSKDPDELFRLFGEYSDTGYGDFNCLTQPQNDEILLELVKNKKLPINKRYSWGFGEASRCTPLYIATRFEKPHILKEMLKRDDIDLNLICGINDNTEIFETLQKYISDNESAYTFFSSKNPKVKDYLTKKLKDSSKLNNEAFLLEVLNKSYPNIPEYDETSKTLKVSRKYLSKLEGVEPLSYDSNNHYMTSLDDVLRNMDVDVNYIDSNGNNLINLSTTCKNEMHALGLYKGAMARGADIVNKNKKGETPFLTLLNTNTNQHILAELVEELSNPYDINTSGENALHIFSKNETESKAVLFTDRAIKNGLSVNSQDSLGNTELMNALENKYYNLFNFLLKNGADVNVCDANGQNILHRACMNYSDPSDLKYIYTLINQNTYPFTKDINGNTPFDYLDEDTRFIVNADSDQYKEFSSLFSEEQISAAMWPKNPTLYNEHLDMYAYSNMIDSNNKLFSSAKISKAKFNIPFDLGHLVKDLSDVKKQEEALLRLNLELRKNSQFKFNTIFDNGDNLLHLLSKINSPRTKECIQSFCETGKVNINALNNLKETALMTAVDSYQMATSVKEKLACIDNINTLLKYKPDVNILDDNLQNVLHRICQMDNIFLLNKFLDLDININQKDRLGKNPIEYLVQDITNKMRIYYENYALTKKLRLGIEETLRRVR